MLQSFIFIFIHFLNEILIIVVEGNYNGFELVNRAQEKKKNIVLQRMDTIAR